MVDSVAKCVSFDFLMNRERATFLVVVKVHLRGVVASFTFDIVAEF